MADRAIFRPLPVFLQKTGGKKTCNRRAIRRQVFQMQLTAVENTIFIPNVSLAAFFARKCFAACPELRFFARISTALKDCGYSCAGGYYVVSFKQRYPPPAGANLPQKLYTSPNYFPKRGKNGLSF